jgi:hypothetical protein
MLKAKSRLPLGDQPRLVLVTCCASSRNSKALRFGATYCANSTNILVRISIILSTVGDVVV